MKTNMMIMMPLFVMLLLALVNIPDQLINATKLANTPGLPAGAPDPVQLFSSMLGIAVPSIFFLGMIMGGIAIAIISGVRLPTGAGLTEFANRTLSILLIFLGLWGLLSTWTFSLFTQLGPLGLLFYFSLTFVYVAGLFLRLSTFGAE